MVSDGPRLVMVFSSGELQGGGFKAKYTFETGTTKMYMYIFYTFVLLFMKSSNINNVENKVCSILTLSFLS